MEKKELSRFELATVKRVAASTKRLRTRRDKLKAIIEESQIEMDTINETISAFDAPIVILTGGYTPEQVLSGEYLEESEVELATVEASSVELSDTELPLKIVHADEVTEPVATESNTPEGDYNYPKEGVAVL